MQLIQLIKKKFQNLSSKHQGTEFQSTVVPKPNQGTIRQRGCNPLSGEDRPDKNYTHDVSV